MTTTVDHVANSAVAGAFGYSPDSGKPRPYHAVRWNEPLIYELSDAGQRGILIPDASEAMRAALSGSPEDGPDGMRRAADPELPEVAQPQVLRHYLRLSQETLGADLNVDIGQGTCTMKYSPKINERFVSAPAVVDMHPRQHPDTAQGLLQILYDLEGLLAEISGMDAVCLQPGAGSAAIYTNIKLVQAFHADRGESAQRTEIVTTIFSHPSNAAAAKTAGYDVITLYPDENGYPDAQALAAVLGERTAALFITNPEDTGIFNPAIADLVRAAHDVGALCVYDQANANGLLGVTNARRAGFDLCHFNLHKTFSTPHACGGPAAGAVCATAALEPFLPGPRVRRDDAGRYTLSVDGDHRIAAIRPFYGVIPNLVRAYAWIRALGAGGLREVADIAVLNNNYLISRILELDGVRIPYAEGHRRIEQARYSWAELTERTGISSSEIGRRLADFGLHYWTSHHPYVVPEPATLEPTEAYSQRELDEYVHALRQAVAEALDDPELLRSTPHRSSVHQIDHEAMNDPATWAPSWRAYRRKYLGERPAEHPHWEPDATTPNRPRPPRAHHR
jgi:glycine dehydrogenase subunit 2